MIPFLLRYWMHIAGGLVVAALLWALYNRVYDRGYDAGAVTIQKQWDKDKRLQEEAIKNAREAVAKIVENQNTISMEIRNVLLPKLEQATTTGLSLSERLRDYQNRVARCGRDVPAIPGTAPGTPAAPGVPEDGGAIGEATDQHFAACARDATRLGEWKVWVDKQKVAFGGVH